MNFGIVPVNKTNAPFPVVIFFSGVNVDAGSYHDLAVEMAAKGLVFITFDWVTNALPGNHTGLTPSVDLKNMTPENITKFPTCLAVQSILNELENINKDSLLQGLLDLDKIIFGGHSAGGSIALLNANPDFFPQVIGAFAYGAHTQGATMLGFAPETFIPLSPKTPFLITGGTDDGVISSSIARYGKTNSDCVEPILKTFEQNLDESICKRFLAIFNGANHFLAVSPLDETSGRSYLDKKASPNVESNRQALFTLVYGFIESICLKKSSSENFMKLANDLVEKGNIAKFLSN